MAKILVTGGAGFIGSHIVDVLIKKGHRVVIVDDLSTGVKKNLNPRARFYKLNIQDKKLAEIFHREKPNYVFHEAAQIDVRKSVNDPMADAKINILGSINVLQNCAQAKVKKVIFASTGGAMYGDPAAKFLPSREVYRPRPVSPYGVAKLSVESYLFYFYKQYGLVYTALRYGNVYGPRQNPHGEAGVVAIFCNKILAGEQPIINGLGWQTRDYVYVGDVVAANLAALKSKAVGEINIGTGVESDVNQIFRLIVKHLGKKVKEIHGPAKPGEQKRSCLDYSLAKKALKWKPKVNLEDGIKKTAIWFKQDADRS